MNDLLRFFQKRGAISDEIWNMKYLLFRNVSNMIKLNNNSFKLSLKKFKINLSSIWLQLFSNFGIILFDIILLKVRGKTNERCGRTRLQFWFFKSSNAVGWIKQAKRYLTPCYLLATVLFTVSSSSREIRCVSVYYSLWCVPISAKFRATGIPFRNSGEEGA